MCGAVVAEVPGASIPTTSAILLTGGKREVEVVAAEEGVRTRQVHDLMKDEDGEVDEGVTVVRALSGNAKDEKRKEEEEGSDREDHRTLMRASAAAEELAFEVSGNTGRIFLHRRSRSSREGPADDDVASPPLTGDVERGRPRRWEYAGARLTAGTSP